LLSRTLKRRHSTLIMVSAQGGPAGRATRSIKHAVANLVDTLMGIANCRVTREKYGAQFDLKIRPPPKLISKTCETRGTNTTTSYVFRLLLKGGLNPLPAHFVFLALRGGTDRCLKHQQCNAGQKAEERSDSRQAVHFSRSSDNSHLLLRRTST
jgi:hypothetical protein